MKRYLYNIGYSTAEDSLYFQMWHTQKFTEKELEAHVEDALWAAILWEVEFHKELKCKGDWKEYTTFSSLIYDDDFLKTLVSKGFERAEFEATWSCDGWHLALDREGRRQDKENKLAGRLLNRLENT